MFFALHRWVGQVDFGSSLHHKDAIVFHEKMAGDWEARQCRTGVVEVFTVEEKQLYACRT